MDAAALVVLVPLAVGSVATGIAQAWITPSGLVRHYWVAFKLVLTVVSTIVLLTYRPTFEFFAGAALADPLVALEDLRNPSDAVHGVLAAIRLTLTTVLAVVKPRGLTLTPWGERRRV